MPQKQQQKPSLAALLRPAVTYGNGATTTTCVHAAETPWNPTLRARPQLKMATTCNCNEPNHLQKGSSPPTSQAPSTTRTRASPTGHDPDIDRSISMALNFLRPGVPGMQPVGDLHTAKSAILFGVINGLFSPPVLELCLCTGGRRRRSPCGGDDDDDAEQQMYYQLANFVLAMLGVALLFVDMALSSRAVIFASPLWPAVVRWMVWLTKALTCGTLQFGVNVVYFCLRMLLARFMLVSA
ncbi:uncharacterized protein LOC8083504 [Sorghum bicolor]|uniref:uncharacterized protein LOC8083504 n=1 Tax=Sorghum bicolor TaxID=4558 RepID=UPI000B4266B6|nr:uncharacterized protein LOC8083504 [Sorghum bicolor]|eukprot:XP_021321117.1 uncharacterized protein LOC8083504 [Sorghum bicolor]